MACIYGKTKCQHSIDTDYCAVSNVCQTLNINGAVYIPALMRRIDFLERALDGLIELDFVGVEGVEWLMVFEKSEAGSRIPATVANAESNVVNIKMSA